MDGVKICDHCVFSGISATYCDLHDQEIDWDQAACINWSPLKPEMAYKKAVQD